MGTQMMKGFRGRDKWGTPKHEMYKYACTTLGITDLQAAVKCPEEEVRNEWLAVHARDFTGHTKMVYTLIEKRCTPEADPTMAAGNMRWDGKTPTASTMKSPRRCLRDSTAVFSSIGWTDNSRMTSSQA